MWEKVWGGMGRCEKVWGGMGRCGEVWGDVGRCGERCGDLGRWRTCHPPTGRKSIACIICRLSCTHSCEEVRWIEALSRRRRRRTPSRRLRASSSHALSSAREGRGVWRARTQGASEHSNQ